jgi:hypothetical protein
VNLEKLADASRQVKCVTYGAVNPVAVEAYLAWLDLQLTPKFQEQERSNILQSVRFSCERLKILMSGDIGNYVTWAADKLADELKDETPIFPVLNDEIKSDAWITGLVVTELAGRGIKLNPGNVGYAVGGTQTGEMMPRRPEVNQPFKVVYIDDATYTGKQAKTVGMNAGQCGVFNMQHYKKAMMVFAGMTEQAKQFLEGLELLCQADIEGGLFQFDDVMRTLPIDADTASAPVGYYARHVEVDPASGLLVPKSGQGLTFQKVSYGMPPYKIPDSISVPTHVYAACGYKQPTGQKQLPETLRHLFQGEGSVDYRTSLRPQKQEFFTPI